MSKNIIHQAINIIETEGLISFIKRSYNFVKFKLNLREKYWRILIPYLTWKIRRVRFNSLEELVDFSFNWMSGVIKPMQVKEEILELLKILQEIKPEVILEIGTANGGTLFLWTRIASPNAIIISIDLPGGVFGGGYPEWKIPLYKSFAKENQRIHLIRADSHDPRTLDKVKEILDSRKVDFLFIDGDHTYEGVKKDFEMYSPLVKKGGIIAFHDIVFGPRDCVGGVPNFWQEIKDKYKNSVEIVKDYSQGGYGIGVIIN